MCNFVICSVWCFWLLIHFLRRLLSRWFLTFGRALTWPGALVVDLVRILCALSAPLGFRGRVSSGTHLPTNWSTHRSFWRKCWPTQPTGFSNGNRSAGRFTYPKTSPTGWCPYFLEQPIIDMEWIYSNHGKCAVCVSKWILNPLCLVGRRMEHLSNWFLKRSHLHCNSHW